MDKKRIRTDTFSHLSSKEICQRINDIINGKHESYILDTNYKVEIDAIGQEQKCWCVRNKHGNQVDQLWSAAAYRSFYVWWVYEKKNDTETNLLKVDRTGNEKYHHGHRCGNEKCCNPAHIRIISRTENEIDKHWHFFLKGEKREEFMNLFKTALVSRNIW